MVRAKRGRRTLIAGPLERHREWDWSDSHMKKAVWSAAMMAAAILMLSTTAHAQLATSNIIATANVGARGRITLTGTINFPDSDPATVAIIDGGTLSVQAQARVAPTTNVELTVFALTDFQSGTDSIAVNNMSWVAGGTGFVNGTAQTGTAQQVGSWTGPGNRNGTQQFNLVNSWNYPVGVYTTTLTYTLSTP